MRPQNGYKNHDAQKISQYTQRQQMDKMNTRQKRGTRKQRKRARSPTPPPAEERAKSPTPPPAEERANSPTPPLSAAERSPSLTDKPESPGPDAHHRPTVDKGKGKKGKSRAADKQTEKKQRKTFTLAPENEDIVFEWLQENEMLWRRGHKLFKDTTRKKALWETKARELEVTAEHLQGWWRGMHTWYVKLHRVKSGQAAKKLTDREMHVLQKCAFYEGEIRHRLSAPMKSVSIVAIFSNISCFYFCIKNRC